MGEPNAQARPVHSDQTMPPTFTFLDEVDPSILVELRYADCHNFVGRPIAGYSNNRAVLTQQAAIALSKAQSIAKKHGLTIKIYDAFRPQKAVDDFVAWSGDIADQKMKAEFYPHIGKAQIFPDGYVACPSGHSRGSTVDLTLVAVPVKRNEPYVDGQPLVDATLPVGERFGDNSIDMGTGFDAFDPAAHTDSAPPGSDARRNRDLLLSIMDSCGFSNYPKEWWHFTLRDEPFPGTYFDFDL